MFNQSNLIKQLKKDGKSSLLMRNVEGTLYITNRHYMVVMPEAMLLQFPKLYSALFDVFGQKMIEHDKNVHILYKRIEECTTEMARLIPNDFKSKAKVTPFVHKGSKIDYRLVMSDDGCMTVNNTYIELIESPACEVNYNGLMQPIVYDNDTCKLLVLPFRIKGSDIESDINTYFKIPQPV